MRNHSKKASVAVTGKRTVGLDLGDQHSYYYSSDDEGQNVESGRVKTSQEATIDALSTSIVGFRAVG